MTVDTVKRNARQYDWQVENTDRINILLPKGSKQEIKEAASRLGVSASELMRQAIREKLDSLEPDTQRQEIQSLQTSSDMLK